MALIHTIGRSEPPTVTNPFIAKYIFPGGYIPALSEMVAAIERSGLIITDIEILRLHYAETLRAWRERFLANWDKAAAILDETLLPDVGVLSRRPPRRPSATRTWSCSRSSSPSASSALPITRDYMYNDEHRLLEQEAIERPPAPGRRIARRATARFARASGSSARDVHNEG